jgi:hypothetical protein
MAVVRIHRYAVDPTDLDEFLARRAALIDAIRAGYSGLAEARLIRLEDGTYVDSWRWDSPEEQRAAGPAAREIPEAGGAMSLTRDATHDDGEIVDER